MFSLISTLSLLVFVLFNGYSTLPILPGQSSDSSITDEVTSGDTLNLQLLINDETSTSSELTTTDEHIGLEESTSINNFPEETTTRSFDEYSTSQPVEFSTEETINEKRNHHHLSLTTDQSITSSTNKNEDLSTTEQSSSEENDHNHSFSSSSEPMIITTEVSSLDKRENKDDDEDFSFTTIESELTTETMLPLTTSTEKFIEHFSNEKSTNSMKKNRKSNHYVPTKPKEEHLEDTRIRTAVFDDKALDKVGKIPNDFLILDESTDLIVTGLPERTSSSSTTMVYREKEELNQGSTLFLFLLAALLFCACVMASTLAFVKNRHTLKRKSRITEMEAFLDDHHYHPFLFSHQK